LNPAIPGRTTVVGDSAREHELFDDVLGAPSVVEDLSRVVRSTWEYRTQ
jgi:hypothetical protein